MAASPQNVNQVSALGDAQALELGFGFGERFAVGLAQETRALWPGSRGQDNLQSHADPPAPRTSRVGLAVSPGLVQVAGPFAGFGVTGQLGIQAESMRFDGEL